MELSINGKRVLLFNAASVESTLSSFLAETLLEVWLSREDGSAMCALMNADGGWLMHLRFEGDAGFTSRSPRALEDPTAMREYKLSNGQLDEYPAGWAVSREEVVAALVAFAITGERSPKLDWHDGGA